MKIQICTSNDTEESQVSKNTANGKSDCVLCVKKKKQSKEDRVVKKTWKKKRDDGNKKRVREEGFCAMRDEEEKEEAVVVVVVVSEERRVTREGGRGRRRELEDLFDLVGLLGEFDGTTGVFVTLKELGKALGTVDGEFTAISSDPDVQHGPGLQQRALKACDGRGVKRSAQQLGSEERILRTHRLDLVHLHLWSRRQKGC